MRAASGSSENRDGEVLVRLTILRHGQTTANAAGIIQGQQPQWPLTEAGVMQARASHEELLRIAEHEQRESGSRGGDPPRLFWRAYSSDLLRAKHTAEIALGRALSSHGQPDDASSAPLLCPSEPIRLDPRLREYALGVREGRPVSLTWRQAEDEWRREQLAQTSRADSSVSARESAQDVQSRTRSFVCDLIADAEQERGCRGRQQTAAPNILLTSHGGCIKVLLQLSFGFPADKIGKLQNGSLTHVDILTSPPDSSRADVVHDSELNCWFRLGPRVNDVRHLKHHSMELLQGAHSLDSLYGALGDDSSAAAEQ